MADRFRDLERPQTGRLKDVVLMATVTGFESLRHPSKSDLRQFSELFEPLYLASSDEARRQAVAALSQCPQIPQPTALFIGLQPISTAAIFLTRSEAIGDDVLIAIAATQGPAYSRAIARRENLSPLVVDALVNLHQGAGQRPAAADATAPEAVTSTAPPPSALPQTAETAIAAPPVDVDADHQRRLREERLRHDIKSLARAAGPREPEPDGLAGGLSEIQAALLVRFARSGETGFFATALADALSTSRDLSERILLDASGWQLGVTLVALNLANVDSAFVLQSLYPHLGEVLGNGTRVSVLLDEIDMAEAIARVRAWQRADGYTGQTVTHEPAMAPNRESDPRIVANRAPPLFARQSQDRKPRASVRGR